MSYRPFYKHFTFSCLLALAVSSSVGQKVLQMNLPEYDKVKLHFGFSLSVNKADFILYRKPVDSVLSVGAIPEWGFNLGIVSDFRLHDYVTIRFLPALSFQTRTLEYFIDSTKIPGTSVFYTETKKVESTLLDFPINLKLRSERLNNMSAYLLAGGKFSIDLASQAKTKNPALVKLTSKDWSLEAGFGLDFYLEYFKLSTEIKFSSGLRDRLFHENTTYSAPIDRLIPKVWLFSLNFEG